jgi:peptidoglycan/LPS O-acetylase OafA/YrhL
VNRWFSFHFPRHLSEEAPHLKTLDAMRGIASMMVVLFHVTQGNGLFLQAGALKNMGVYGWLGVDVFFIISGFVIPLSLYRTNFKIWHYGRFIMKRLIRLEPPYLVSLVVVLVLGYLSTFSSYYHGSPFLIDWKRVLLHIGYLNAFVGKDWLSPVYWSLGVEFQYYLIIGLLFPLLIFRSKYLTHAVLVLLILSGFASSNLNLIFFYVWMFILGIVAFLFYVKHFNWWDFAVYLLIVGGLLFHAHFEFFIVGFVSLFCILCLDVDIPVLNFLGKISYSLYLLHIPIGSRIVNFSTNFHRTSIVNFGIICFVIVVCCLASYLFYLVLEKPFQTWSSQIKLSNAPVLDSVLPPE